MPVPSIVVTAEIVSLSSKAVLVLSVPEFIYFTNNVLGSVPSVATWCTTLAWTPEEAPVNVNPTKFDRVIPTEAESVNEVNLTA